MDLYAFLENSGLLLYKLLSVKRSILLRFTTLTNMGDIMDATATGSRCFSFLFRFSLFEVICLAEQPIRVISVINAPHCWFYKLTSANNVGHTATTSSTGIHQRLNPLRTWLRYEINLLFTMPGNKPFKWSRIPWELTSLVVLLLSVNSEQINPSDFSFSECFTFVAHITLKNSILLYFKYTSLCVPQEKAYVWAKSPSEPDETGSAAYIRIRMESDNAV